MSFSVPIGGTVVTAIALCVFNRKWILKQFSQCCHKFCVCTTAEDLPEPEEDLKITENRWQHMNNHNHHNHFNELYHHHDHHDLLDHHDETKV